ncbi:UDP-N-acetylmuramate--L-alanine ligase [Clostridia bacterium]|nr:UDP-N-acetylmuramate--L-alanine ligase [Clostridia bacterium]
MSGLAEILNKEGFFVSGSDAKSSPLTEKLEHLGVLIFYGHDKSNLPRDAQLTVYTAAVKSDNPEWIASTERDIPMLSRAQLLGQIMDNYSRSVAISGTHGKTTTTSMLTDIFLAAKSDPTVSVGGILSSIDGNIRVGSSDIFLTEACEYTNSFLHFYPKYALILNIEEDHMDFFSDLSEIRHSFAAFAGQVATDGTLLLNGDIAAPDDITVNCVATVTRYGFDPSYEFYAQDVHFHAQDGTSFSFFQKDAFLGEIKLRVPGIHNVSNALGAAALALTMGIPFASIQLGLTSFLGTARRFEYKGELGGITIVDDYAHHPTEISATLTAAANYPHKRIICIFQPHTYTRTKAFLLDFAKALSAADLVILTDIYAAREKNTIGISSADLLKELNNYEVEAYYEPSFDAIEAFLLKKCLHGDLLITMGAGDVYRIGEHLLGLS